MATVKNSKNALFRLIQIMRKFNFESLKKYRAAFVIEHWYFINYFDFKKY